MKNYKKLLLISCILCIIQMFFLPIKAEKLTGTAEEIQWEYNDETKTLTFWGKGKIPDGSRFDCWGDKEKMSWESKSNEIEHIILNEGITEIGESTFCFMTNLKSVKLCNSLEIIGEMAFWRDDNLESIEFPEKLKEIKCAAFDQCAMLKEIILPESLEDLEDNAFFLCTSLEKVKLPSSLKTIPVEAFGSCSSLKEIEIPENVTTIGAGAFESTGIEQIIIPENAINLGNKYIGYSNGIFQSCRNLTKVQLPSKLKEIPYRMFDGCSNLKSIEIPESVTIIGEGAFARTGIEQIMLPPNVKNVGKNDVDLYHHYGIFEGCTQLTDVRLPSNLKEIPYRMFDGCTSLTSIKIPKSVTTIGEGAFARTGIKKITLPKNVTYIGKNKVDKNNHYGVFEECTSLKEIVVRSKKVKKVTKYTWNGLQKSAVIRVPKSKKKEYQKLFRKAKLSKKQKVRMIK